MAQDPILEEPNLKHFKPCDTCKFLKGIIHLNVKAKLTNILDENVVECFYGLGLGKDFLQDKIYIKRKIRK